MSEQIDLPIPGTAVAVAKRSLQGQRGMQALLHASSASIWKAAILFCLASVMVAGISGMAYSGLLSWPDRLSFLALPMFWVLIAMPLNLLVQIARGNRGLRGDLHFLSASLGAFCFFLPFSIGLSVLPFAVFAEEGTLMAGFGFAFFCLLMGLAWASTHVANALQHLFGVPAGFAAIKSAGIQSLLVFVSIGCWAYCFPVWQSLDPFAFK